MVIAASLLLMALSNGLLADTPVFTGLVPEKLQCELRTEPLGVDVAQPRLGWISTSTIRSDAQTAYQIIVASSGALLNQENGDLWDSGKVISSEQTQVPYGGQALASSRRVYWKVRVWDAADAVSSWSAAASWTMGLLNPADWQAQWIGETNPPTGSTAAPGLLLRREFNVSPNLVRAVMHVSGLGFYTLTVNGAAATENLLEPGWTEYTKTVLYQTYDITQLIQSGVANAVGLSLGHGVYDITGAPDSRYVKFTRSSGELKAIAQIRLEYADGSTQIIGTNTNWKVGASPITFENLFAGEDYDARLVVPGWDRAGFSPTWPAAAVVTSPGGTLHGLSRAAPPVRKHETFSPKSINPISPGIYIYDMGQNASVMPRLVVHGPAGSRVRIIPAELLGSNGYVDRQSSTQDGVRPAWWQYTLKGSGSESWFPQFFYHGSRYWQVELLPKTIGGALPTVESLQAVVVHSDSPVAGSFETSSELFNKTWSLVCWAQRSNMMSVMTDCPHREKMPWLEQIQLNGPALRYNFDMRAHMEKGVNDMADAQLSNGFVPNIAPEYFMVTGDINNGFRNSPEWGGAMIMVPWQQYQFSGDVTLLSTRYPMMKSYVAFLASPANNHIISTGLGDWYDIGQTSGGGQLTPANLTATAHYFYFNRVLATVAARLGQTADATLYTQHAENIRNAFNAMFFNTATGTYSTGSQTANAMPLAMGIPEPQHRAGVLAAIIRDIRQRGNALSSGEVGHRYLLLALAQGGRSDVIYDMHSQSDKPGYGMQIARDRTALTEKWNGDAGDYGSQNHFMQGHINEWFFHDLAGIQPDETAPGFRSVIIKPAIVGDLTFCNASYESVYGLIASRWSLAGSALTMDVTIPVGATATVHVPAANGSVIHEGGIPVANAPGVQLVSHTNHLAMLSVRSGTYVFTSTMAPASPGLLTANSGSGQAVLQWSSSPTATAYHVKRTTVAGGPYTTIAENITATSFTDSGLVNGTRYYYVVSAVTSSSESADSEEASAFPMQLSNAGFEDPYTGSFQYNPAGGSWIFSASSEGNGSGITANGSPFSSGNSAAPQGRQAAFLQGNSSITQAINGLTPGASYTLTFSAAQRATGSSWNHNGQTWKITLNSATIATYAPSQSATAYTDYSVTFTAATAIQTVSFVGTNTRTGDNTAFIDNVRLLASVPPAPTGLTATSGSLQVILQWNAVVGTNGYQIQRSAGQSPVVTLAGNGTLTTYTDTNLAFGTTYTYTVKALNEGGAGPESNTASASPGAPPISEAEKKLPKSRSTQTGAADVTPNSPSRIP